MKHWGLGALVGLLCCGVAAMPACAGDFTLLKLAGSTVHWQSGYAGHAPVLTYAIVTTPLAFDGARNCRKLSALDDLETRSALPDDLVRREIAAAVAMWQSVASIDFRETRVTKSANIVIGARSPAICGRRNPFP